MENQGECFVSGELATVLRISRLFGAAPLWFQKQGDQWRVSLAPRLHRIGCVIVLILSVIIIWTFLNGENLQGFSSLKMATKHVTDLLQALLVMVVVVAVVQGALGRIRCMVACVNQVQKINFKLNTHNAPTRQKQIGLYVLWLIAYTFLIIFGYVMTITILTLKNVATWVKVNFSIYFIYFMVIEIGMIQFMMMAMHVRTSFKTVNDRLRSLLTDITTECKLKRTHHETIRQITWAYATACNMVRDMNRSHGLIMMMYISCFFLHLIISPYFLLINFLVDNTKDLTVLAVLDEIIQSIWCTFHVINLMMFIEPCHLTYKEMEVTRELVSRLMRRPHSVYDPLGFELEHFYKQLLINEVSYKPLNVLTIQRSLVISILGNITTYLVIIIEMK